MVTDNKLKDIEPKLPINYRLLSDGLDYYEARGYVYQETPWVVSDRAITATLPKDTIATKTQYGNLVGSAEQGFIELMLRRSPIHEKACSISPCFRLENTYDNLHHAYFMKLELINTDATLKNLDAMIADAIDFYKKYREVIIVKTGVHSYDILDKKHKVELGSYGIRKFRNRKFIYGTGVALPRLDTVIVM